MKLKTRLGIILLVFGVLPVGIMFWVGTQNGLSANPSFHSAVAMALMASLLAGMLIPGVMMQFFFNRHLQRIREFCKNVKLGRYDVSLEVPNSDNDNSEDEDELTALMRDMNWMAHCIKVNDAGLRQALHDLEKSQAEIQQQKLELTEALGKLRNLMDNAGQGFLSFSSDLKVSGEYSAECIMIFNREIGDTPVAGLLYPEDVQQQVFIEALFTKIFCETDDFLRKNFFSLLPEELNFDGSYIHIDYKLIDTPSAAGRKEIMLILTDITERRAMEKRIQEEKNILSMVVQTVTHYQDFVKAVREYQVFAREELPAILKTGRPAAEKLSMIFRSVHTWKGIFGQLGLERLAANLHYLESELVKLRNDSDQGVRLADLNCFFARHSPQELSGWLNAEMELLTGILGDNFFFQEETVVVESIKLRQLEEKVQKLLPPAQARPLVADLRRLRYKPFKDLLGMYPDYIVNMAANQEKELKPFSITGGECLVDPSQYHEFAKSLIHVFRNAVAHGLETPDERLAANKEPSGRISCVIKEHDHHIVLEIEDDGRGIDGGYIREIAAAKGIYSSEMPALSNQEALQLIFADGFSSATSTSELAGRGVGLFAVQAEVERLGGDIEVNSRPGFGTTFRFILPRFKELRRFDIRSFGKQVLEESNHYLQQMFNVATSKTDVLDSSQRVIPMRNVSAFIDVSGSFNGRLMLSADAQFVTRLAEHYMDTGSVEEYDKALLESIFAEFFNTIAGNALQALPEWQTEVNIGAPVTIWAEGASAQYGDAGVCIWNITTQLGQIYFGLVSFEEERADFNGTDINC